MSFKFSLYFYIELLIVVFAIYLVIKNKIFYAHTKKMVQVVDETEIRELIRRKKQVIDTRAKDDVTFDSIRGVRNISTMDFMQKNYSLLWNEPIYVIDWNEKKELKSANKIRKLGAKDIYILKGGMTNVDGTTVGRLEKIEKVKLPKD